jgi:hypothetical protein
VTSSFLPEGSLVAVRAAPGARPKPVDGSIDGCWTIGMASAPSPACAWFPSRELLVVGGSAERAFGGRMADPASLVTPQGKSRVAGWFAAAHLLRTGAAACG